MLIQSLFTLLLATSSTLSAFTIINQTDEPRNITIEEAYRPPSADPSRTEAPKSLGHKPISLTLSPNSSKPVPLHESCPMLLVSIKTVKKSGNTTTTSTSTTCYNPYEYLGQDYPHFTNDWALVICHPEELPKSTDLRDFHTNYRRKIAIEQGYGIKALHPLLLEEALESGHLPSALR